MSVVLMNATCKGSDNIEFDEYLMEKLKMVHLLS